MTAANREVVAPATAAATINLQAAPAAKKVPQITFLHGKRRQDDYAWMRVEKPREDEELMAHLKAENRYAESYMADTGALQETLYEEMRARTKEADQSVPYQIGKWLYYTRTEEGKEYDVYCRRENSPAAVEEILLDINQLAAEHEFFDVGCVAVSPDGSFLAYTFDITGDTAYSLKVIDLRNGEILSTEAQRVQSVAWSNDCRTIYYTTQDATTRRDNQVWRHDIGRQSGACVFEEPDETFRVAVRSGASGKFIYLDVESHTTAMVACVESDTAGWRFTPVTCRKPGVKSFVDDDGGFFYILTNEGGAKDYKVMKAPCSNYQEGVGPEQWQEILPHRPGILLETIRLFANHLVVFEKDSGITRVRVQDLRTADSGETHYVEFPEPIYEVRANNDFGADMDSLDNISRGRSDKLRLTYNSMVSPPTVFEYDLDTRKLTPLKVEEVIGYDASLYRTERLYATARDGTKVPISIVYKGDLKLDGHRPCHVYGYGSYGFGMPANFRSWRISLLDRGYIYAIAHIRGGNELGEAWREDGKLKRKMNTFFDFIDCVHHLVKGGYTRFDRVTIQGGSAGGLLMGAVLNLEPTIARAAILNVPFVDVINTMLDESLPLTVGEFEEWGNPKVPADFEYMIRYSPYDNIQATAYPAMLVRTGLSDDKVGYFEPAKYVAKMRTLRTDDNPLISTTLLSVGGHHGLSGRFEGLRETAFEYAFLLKQVAHAIEANK